MTGGIEVVLAVHDGAAWLERQVATIAAQTLRPTRLLVLNDGSRDASAALLKQLEVFYGGWLQQLPAEPPGCPRGCVASFARLLEATTAPYVALADQDDLWDQCKLAASMDLLRVAEMVAVQGGSRALWRTSPPMLVHSDARLIDGSGRLLHPSWWRQQGLEAPPCDLWDLAARNRVMGCTVLLNRACLELALPIPTGAVLHDWWLALVAERAGGLLQLRQVTLSHRRHGANASGSARWWQWPRRSWVLWRQWCALRRRFGDPLKLGDVWRLLRWAATARLFGGADDS